MKKYDLMTTLALYLLILCLVFLWQRKLIYFPEKFSSSQQQEKLSELNLTAWPSAHHYRGLISSKPLRQTKGTVIIFHGNAGSATGRSYYFDALEKLGYRVIVAEYPGYGSRPGKPTEETLVKDGIKTVQTAFQQFGKPLFLWGESLGTGVVSGILKNNQLPLRGIILLMPFDSLSRIAQAHYWYLFGGLLTQDKFNNIKNLQNYKGNVAVLLSNQDQLIPNKHTLRLYESLQTNKKLWTFENAGHNNWPSSASLPWWREVMQFVDN